MTRFAIELLRNLAGDPAGVLEAPGPEDLDWLISSGLGPLLERQAQVWPGWLDPVSRERVRAADRSALMLSEQMFVVLERILEQAGARDCPITLLKGVGVAQQLYPRRHWRLMRDIDLLVEPDDQPVLEQILRGLGFRQVGSQPPEFYVNHHHSMPFHHSEWRCWIEVHTALFRPDSRAGRIAGLQRPALHDQWVPVAHPHATVTRLSDAVQLVYTAVHWGTKLTVTGGLMPVMDTLLLLHSDGDTVDWDHVLTICADSAAARHLALMLAFLEHHALYQAPARVVAGLAHGRRSIGRVGMRLLINAIDDYVAAGKPLCGFTSEAMLNVRWDTLLGDGAATYKLLLLPWRLLFPPGSQDRYHPSLLMRRGRSLLRRMLQVGQESR